ncbi:hypothetical protein [Nonomuraea typhae]|uniref:hypothetical protein n=1 Tax=Nonomuraea typhae TaxID=2603600 RepID=UPI0012F767CA|nr:hypothetical protein [Nonomuraea typhae]
MNRLRELWRRLTRQRRPGRHRTPEQATHAITALAESCEFFGRAFARNEPRRPRVIPLDPGGRT